MNSFIDNLPTVVQMIIVVIAVFWSALTFLIPFVLYFSLVELRKQTDLLKSTDQTPLHQTKLLTEIRNALQSMQAVGIDTEEENEPPPRINNPASVPPARERLRR